ncbi:A/G-specific adenine glycosylase [Acidiphilium sp. MT5]
MNAAPPSLALLRWYYSHRRDLPWRTAPGQRGHPYRVWLSEIMLQQTTVTTVIPYFQRFLEHFPTIADLAAAPDEQVLNLWAGLGYYARARNLIACARAVSAQGGFPATLDGLRALPGIGAYTAAAIGAIAFALPVVPVDGNVERVTARMFAINEPLPAAKPAIAAAAATLGAQKAARAQPGDFAQALFDLGATICTPRTPSCLLCPWQRHCAAHAQGIAATLPRKAAKTPRPIRYGTAFLLRDAQGQIGLRRRPPSGLLGGMLELPGSAWTEQPNAPTAPPITTTWHDAGAIIHVFTHFELRLAVRAAHIGHLPNDLTAAPPDAPLPTVMKKAVAAGLAALLSAKR